MKKIIVSILALTVLISCMIPCADTDSFFHDGSKNVASVSNPVAKDFNRMDACSPFCVCSCCGSFSTKAPLADIIFKISSGETVYNTFVLQKPSTISLPVWEPPKIG